MRFCDKVVTKFSSAKKNEVQCLLFVSTEGWRLILREWILDENFK